MNTLFGQAGKDRQKKKQDHNRAEVRTRFNNVGKF